MAFRKRRFRRRFRKGGGKRGLATKAYVRKAVNRKIEMKVRYYGYTAVGYNVTGGAASDFSSVSYGSSSIVAGLCSGIANGTGEGQRVGGSITLKGVQVNMVFQPGDNTNYLRLMLVSPKKQADLTSTSAFVQQLMSNQASGGTQWLSSPDTDNFIVHFNKRLFMSFRPLDGSSATTVPIPRFVNKFVKFNKPIKWAIANGTVPQREVYLVAISDSAAVANPGAVSGFVKLWYTDA